MMTRIAAIVGGALLVGAIGLFAVGVTRYGGPSGLWLRVRAEIAAQRPRPDFVPTPLPTATRSVLPTIPESAPNPAIPAAGTVQAAATPIAGVTPSLALALSTASPDASEAPMAPASPAAPLTRTSTVAAPLPLSAGSSATAGAPAPVVELTGLAHAWQTWNNCGPATLSMCLSYWNRGLDQEEIRRMVRPNPEDKHAGAEELAAVARAQGLYATARVDGSNDTLRRLVAAGIPVMVSTWHEDDPGDGMGHYRLVVGYDDTTEDWLLYDSLAATVDDASAPYRSLRLGYDDFARLWEVFNRRYLVVYDDTHTEQVEAIIGEDLDDSAMWSGALAHANAEISADGANAFAWFNLGSDLVALGRFDEAASAYDHARQLGLPWRMLWYQLGPFPAYYHAGRLQEVLALADATLAVTADVEELHYWRGRALAALGDPTAARTALERALAQRPDYPEAQEALAGLD